MTSETSTRNVMRPWIAFCVTSAPHEGPTNDDVTSSTETP